MALILEPNRVRELYAELAERGVAAPCFCAEDQRTIEAIFSGAAAVGNAIGVADVPVSVAFTSAYPGRSQTENWTTLRDRALGARMFFDDIEALAGADGPFRDLRVLVQLDHGQWDEDEDLLEHALDKFSCVMYDCSSLPFEENIRRTADYVERHGRDVTVEGAVDEIFSEGGGEKDELCTVERAERYVRETGVDLIVPNLGTEHRAMAETARYHGDLARAISSAVGKRLCLHGTSSLGTHDIDRLKDDGIIKINVWTRMAKVGGQAEARRALVDLGNILEAGEIRQLIEDGFLGPKFSDPAHIRDAWRGSLGPKLEAFPTLIRRNAWVDAVIPVIEEYLFAFGYRNFSD